MNTLLKEINYHEPDLSFLDRARIFLRAAPPSPQEMGLAQSDLYVLDIDCSANLNYPNLEIERLCFSLNNIPLSIKGKVAFGEMVTLDLAFVLSLANLEKPMAGNFKKIELGIKGGLGKEGLKGDGQLNLDFVKKKKSNTPLERIELGFKDLKFYFTGYPVLALFLGQADLFCRTENNDYRILLRDFNSVFNLGDNRFKSVEYNCRFYDGFLKGLGKIDWLQSPPRITSLVRIKGASANKLDGVLVHFSKVFGKLSAQMRFSNYPHLNLKGGMLIQRGYVRDLNFLNGWRIFLLYRL